MVSVGAIVIISARAEKEGSVLEAHCILIADKKDFSEHIDAQTTRTQSL